MMKLGGMTPIATSARDRSTSLSISTAICAMRCRAVTASETVATGWVLSRKSGTP